VHFLFFNHSLKWFLMVHLKIFSLKNIFFLKKIMNKFILLFHVTPTINHDATIIFVQHVWLRSKFHFTITTLITSNITFKQHVFVIHQNHHSLKSLIYYLIFETQVCQKYKLSSYIYKYTVVLHILFFICNLWNYTNLLLTHFSLIWFRNIRNHIGHASYVWSLLNNV
jgi:hypothetical protein